MIAGKAQTADEVTASPLSAGSMLPLILVILRLVACGPGLTLLPSPSGEALIGKTVQLAFYGVGYIIQVNCFAVIECFREEIRRYRFSGVDDVVWLGRDDIMVDP